MESPLGFEKEREIPSCNYKLVPWISWDEWNFVRESLFSSSPPSVAAALRRISAWQSRGCLPVLIEVTAAIVEVQQMDPFFRNDLINDFSKSEEMLAMLYSMAIMRLVNGAVEKTREADKFTIAEAARKIDLPRVLIDIRHEGSHRDLPSLHLVRPASVKALDWLKSYYWEPQKKAAPSQSDEITNVRKQIRSELRILAKALNAKDALQSDSSQRKEIPMKHQSSKYEDIKKQIAISVKILVRLYNSFPSEIAAVLLEYLLKAMESSNDNAVELSDKSEMELDPEHKRSISSSVYAWKQIIERISNREPELLLIMLKSILEMVEAQDFMKSEVGGADALFSQCKSQIPRTAGLFSMVVWLLKSYQRAKKCKQQGSIADIQASSAETDTLKVTLTNVLRKFLLAYSPGNDKFQVSVILAEMIGNSHMVQKVKKLSQLGLANTKYIEDVPTHTSIEQIILHEEELMSQAAKKLEILKQHRLKGKNPGPARNGGVHKESGPWTVAKLWSPCPIGMLPSEFGSVGVLPFHCEAISPPEERQQCPDGNERCEMSSCTGKRDANFDANLFENSSVRKKRRADVIENSEGEDSYNPQEESFKGRLLIGGIWRKVGKDELLGLSSAVRILV